MHDKSFILIKMNNTGAKRTPRREEVTPEPTLLSNMATLFGGFLNGGQ
jgi:hypothetical protein